MQIDPPVRPRAVSMLEASNVYASIDLHGEDLYSTIMEQVQCYQISQEYK